ncbi:MAG TPA: PEP/pyruvate-binding domain-containing protein, partial [Longimicrobiaceae bacterium]|nr:PEP/pyruvate-binding domain-containing protein [Longimicrobiaceae bacterium]
VRALELPEEFRAELLEALKEAGLREQLLAVRSSAAQEDGASASFAGQFDTVLGVRGGEDGSALWDAVRQVWASAFSAHAAIYSQQHLGAQEHEGVRMAVILQEMVDAAVSGVAFSADPVSGSREVSVISAVYGLGEGLVGGELNADSYRIRFTGDAPGSVQREIVWKEHAYRMLPEGGTALVAVPVHLWDLPALTDEEATRIAGVARRLASVFGVPQDLEWALVAAERAEKQLLERPQCRLVILQTRPITTLSPEAQADATAVPRAGGGERRIWDNSNIIESYSGVTTPLTFSFARGVYEDVYLQFCRLMGVSEKLLTEHRHVFAGMLGLIRGRFYYNLLNWYRVLALLPGYSVNREFMEGMMGVREKLSDPPPTPPVAGRWEDTRRLARMAGRLLREQRRLRHEVPAFHARVQAALAPVAGKDLCTWSAKELVDLYRRLEGSLLRHWRAPLVNDFFAMIFFGLLVRLIEKWLPDAPPTLANDLLCGEGKIISTEPARRVMELA